MRKTLRFMSLLATMLVAGTLTGHAQFTVNTTAKYGATNTESVKLSDVATAFGVTAEQFATDYTAWVEAAKAENKEAADALPMVVEITNDNGTYPNDELGYTAGFNGTYWMTTDGTPIAWGVEGFAWFIEHGIDTDEDVLYFTIGHNSAAFDETTGGTAAVTLNWKYSGKTVTFAVKLMVEPKPVVEGIETEWANVNVVGTQEFLVAQQPDASWKSTTVSEALNEELFTKLGLDKDVLADELELRLYVREFNFSTDEGTYGWTGLLNNNFTANGVGFWFGATTGTTDEDIDTEYPECASRGYSANCNFFVEGIEYDGETFNFNIGQYPGRCKENKDYYASLYVMNGNKAYELKITLHIDEQEVIEFGDMTQVGQQTIDLVGEVAKSGYPQMIFTVDLDDIATTLGIDQSEIDYHVLADETSLYTGGPTADNDGWYMTREGYVGSWGAGDPFFILYPNGKSDKTTLALGQYGGQLDAEVGDKFTFKLFVLNESEYYLVNVVFTVGEKEPVTGRENWKVVDKQEYSAQLISSEGYDQTEKTQMEQERIVSVLGTDTYKMFALTEPGNLDPGTFAEPGSLSGPPVGFWMSKDGIDGLWNQNNSYGVGVTASTGVLSWWSIPDANAVGETYHDTFFLVNESNGNMVQLTLHVSYVDVKTSLETVGEEDVIIVLNDDFYDDGEGYYYVTNDLSGALEVLEMDESEVESGEWYVAGTTGVPTVKVDDFNSIEVMFNAEGRNVRADADDAVFGLGYDYAANTPRFVLEFPEVEPTADMYFKTAAAYVYEGKAYVFNFYIYGEDTYTGINNVNVANNVRNMVYDLSGRVVRRDATVEGLSRGVYITNGKKVLVK